MASGVHGGYSDLVTRQREKGEEVAHPLAILRWAVITSPQDCGKKHGAPALAPSTLSPNAVLLSAPVPLSFHGEQTWLHGFIPLLPTPALTAHTMASREAQVFAPLMCSKKKRQLSHAQQEIPRAGALSLAPSSLAFIYSWAACVVCSEGFFSPCAEEILAAAGLLYWHEMTDVSLPLCAHQPNKLPQQQHVPTGATVLMEGPPALGGCSSVTLAHTATLGDSAALAWLGETPHTTA